MIFNKILDDEIIDKDISIFRRDAVRAIVYKDNRLLMIHTNEGDYKFPGGGIEEEESHKDAVIRELLEETGYRTKMVGDLVGVLVERKPDKFNNNMFFEMNSNYYLCEITGVKEEQKLDAYEADLEFEPVWISIDDAITENQNIINSNINIRKWVYRDLYALKRLKEHFSKI